MLFPGGLTPGILLLMRFVMKFFSSEYRIEMAFQVYF